MSDSLMKCIKQVISVCVFCSVMLCGCIVSDGYTYDISTEEYETDYSTVYAEIISFNGFKNKEYQSELNMSIESDVTAAVEEFDVLAQQTAEVLPQGVRSAFKITQNVKRNSEVLSFIEEHYIFTGGAHGSTSWFPRTIDTTSESPHVLSLGELFTDDNYLERINSEIERMVENNPDKYSELWEQPVVTEDNEGNFYLTEQDLVIFFPPYTLSYYAKGFIEFPIKLSELDCLIGPLSGKEEGETTCE